MRNDASANPTFFDLVKELQYSRRRHEPQPKMVNEWPLDFNRSFYADDAAFIFYQEKELDEISTFVATRVGSIWLDSLFTSAQKEPDRVTSKSKAMYILARTRPHSWNTVLDSNNGRRL
jgi:hypothetical protein